VGVEECELAVEEFDHLRDAFRELSESVDYLFIRDPKGGLVKDYKTVRRVSPCVALRISPGRNRPKTVLSFKRRRGLTPPTRQPLQPPSINRTAYVRANNDQSLMLARDVQIVARSLWDNHFLLSSPCNGSSMAWIEAKIGKCVLLLGFLRLRIAGAAVRRSRLLRSELMIAPTQALRVRGRGVC